jgi:serine/threonine protein kinase
MDRILEKCDMLFEKSSKERNLSDFETLSSLGSGSYARVYKVKSIKTGKSYAMKEILKKQITINFLEDYIKNEIEIMKKVHSLHIIKLKTYFEDEHNIYLIIELAEGGQLYRKMMLNNLEKEKKIKVKLKSISYVY